MTTRSAARVVGCPLEVGAEERVEPLRCAPSSSACTSSRDHLALVGHHALPVVGRDIT